MMKLSIKFEPRDVFIGVFWRKRRDHLRGGFWREAFVCLLPCLPIYVGHWRHF